MGRWNEEEKEDISEGAEAKKVARSLIELAHFLNSDPTDSAEEEVTNEISEDLTPFIEERDGSLWLSPDPTHSLDKLLKKINGLAIRIKWWRGPNIGKFVYWREGRRALKIPGDKKKGSAVIQHFPDFEAGHPHPKLKVIKGSDVGFLRNEGYSLDVLRVAFYCTIAQALESAEFNKFRKCARCGGFFVAGLKGAWKYCNPSVCGKEADREAAHRRRAKRRKNKELLTEHAKDTEAFRRFSQFMGLARKATHSPEELSKLNPILKELGKGRAQKGWEVVNQWERGSKRETWKNLPQSVKRLFEGDRVGRGLRPGY